MKYPSLEITELALAPKFFGTYESQLHTQLFKLFETGYDDILDVGCAEGYYAVGFAMKSKDSTVHCFDINIADLEFCSKMAQLNGVSNITYNSFCSPNTLINFQHRGRTLIFCDCEGYEIDLFTEEVVATLKTTDVLIEFHDLHNNAISKTLLDRFKKTHDVAVINNEDQFSRINICAQIDKMSPKDRVFVKTEHRGGEYQMRYMEWGFFQAKSL